MSRTRSITKRTVDGLKIGDVVWDTELRGFGVRCQRRDKVYVLKYRHQGRQRWISIGKHGSPWTPDQARKEALRLLGALANGVDPAEARDEAKDDLTISDLCDLYLAEGCTLKKASTLATDRGRIERHIKPILGKRHCRNLNRADVEQLRDAVAAGKTAADIKTVRYGRAIVKGGKGTANKAVTLLSAMLSFAVTRGLRSDNPAQGVKLFPGRKTERFLSPEELVRLGEALSSGEREGINPAATNAIRLLAMTGCRRNEIVTLRWSEVDFERACLRLTDTKTGAKVVPIGAPVLKLLADLPRFAGNDYVLPGTKKGQHFVGLPKIWRKIRARAGLQDVRLHDLRHSYASVGIASGDSLYTISKLLGHRQTVTTARYAHLANDPLKAAADRISGQISDAMNDGGIAEEDKSA